MMKYRKRPIVVEAFRLGYERMPQWFLEVVSPGCAEIIRQTTPNLHFPMSTAHGVMHVVCGDYIIRGIKGELYPCKAEVFEQTYERVEGQDNAE